MLLCPATRWLFWQLGRKPEISWFRCSGCRLGCCQPESEQAKPGEATNSTQPKGLGWNSTESSSTLADERAIVLGGFNQSIPRQWAPEGVYEGPIRTVEGFEIATEGNLEGVSGPAIDHITNTLNLVSQGASIWPDGSEDVSSPE